MLAAVPSSKVEFGLLFTVTTIDVWRNPAVKASFEDFFDAVADLGASLLDIAIAALRMSTLGDGEAKNYTDGIAATICAESPSIFQDVLRRLSQRERAFVPSCD